MTGESGQQGPSLSAGQEETLAVIDRETLEASSEFREVQIGNVLLLPAQQRQLLNFLMRQSDVSLETIASQLSLDSELAEIELNELVQGGWIETYRRGGQPFYAIKEGMNSGNPGRSESEAEAQEVIVILNSSGREVLLPGESFHLGVTVTNAGRYSAIMDVFLEDVALEVMPWWVTTRESLALGAGQSGEVIFTLQVPVTATPESYEYQLVVDAPQHYPEETPIHYPQRLQILPSLQDTVANGDPNFIVQPKTQPQKPLLIAPGGGSPIQILVQNRSDRVDRFRLTCEDLLPAWVQVTYPQSDSGLGVVLTPDSLKLNPGEHGLIMLLITPPIDAIAGIQAATIRLYSDNHPDLVMRDWLYLQISANHLLQTELRTIVNKVQRKAGSFQVRFTNLGNTPRSLNLTVKNLEEADYCDYQLSRSQIQVTPKSTIAVDLAVQPNPLWRQPFIGGAKILNFAVEVEDQQQLPLPSDQLTSFIIWQARPVWQFLLLVLTILMGIGAIGYALWWFLLRVPDAPKVLEFSSESSQYSAVNDEAVRLNWRVSEPDRLKTITIQGLAPDGKPMTLPMVYDLSQGIPQALQASCKVQRELICQSVRTSALKPGDYVFSIVTVSKEGRGAGNDTKTTAPVKIEPIPKPQITGFNSTQPVYQEVNLVTIATPPPPHSPTPTPAPSPTSSPTPTPTPEPQQSTIVPSKTPPAEVLLNWSISNPQYLQAIHLVAKSPEGVVLSPLKQFDLSQGIPKELQPFCKITTQLVCQNVKTGDRKPNNYVYELAAISKGEGAIATQKTDLIKLLPKPIQILSLTLNGQPANLPKYLVPVTPNQPVSPLILGWEIEASEGSKVELLPAPGSIPLKGSLPFPINPTPGALTLTLQITSPTGEKLARAIVIETYDPSATDPAAAAAAAAAKAVTNAEAANKAAAANPPANAAAGEAAPGEAQPSMPGVPSPLEIPPQSY